MEPILCRGQILATLEYFVYCRLDYRPDHFGICGCKNLTPLSCRPHLIGPLSPAASSNTKRNPRISEQGRQLGAFLLDRPIIILLVTNPVVTGIIRTYICRIGGLPLFRSVVSVPKTRCSREFEFSKRPKLGDAQCLTISHVRPRGVLAEGLAEVRAKSRALDEIPRADDRRSFIKDRSLRCCGFGCGLCVACPGGGAALRRLRPGATLDHAQVNARTRVMFSRRDLRRPCLQARPHRHQGCLRPCECALAP